jgi:hypothetical protein
MERTLNMKWDAVKKGIPATYRVAMITTYHTILQILQLISKNLQKTNYKSYIWAKPFLPFAYPGFFKSTLWQENDLCTVR